MFTGFDVNSNVLLSSRTIPHFEDFSQQTSDFIPQSSLIMISGFTSDRGSWEKYVSPIGKVSKLTCVRANFFYPNLLLTRNPSLSQHLDVPMTTFAKGVAEEDPRAVTTY